jgi:hypothetical protein
VRVAGAERQIFTVLVGAIGRGRLPSPGRCLVGSSPPKPRKPGCQWSRPPGSRSPQAQLDGFGRQDADAGAEQPGVAQLGVLDELGVLPVREQAVEAQVFVGVAAEVGAAEVDARLNGGVEGVADFKVAAEVAVVRIVRHGPSRITFAELVGHFGFEIKRTNLASSAEANGVEINVQIAVRPSSSCT